MVGYKGRGRNERSSNAKDDTSDPSIADATKNFPHFTHISIVIVLGLSILIPTLSNAHSWVRFSPENELHKGTALAE